METTYLIIYDITDDNLRNKIAGKLEDYGLERIQYSAFLGKLKRYQLNSLIEELKEILQTKQQDENEKRNIQIYPLFKINLKAKIEIDVTNGKVKINAPKKQERVHIL